MTKAKKQGNNWIDISKYIVEIITGLSIIVGIFLGLSEFNKSRKELDVAIRILKLSSLQHQNRIFEQNRKIRHKRQEFVDFYKRKKSEGIEKEYIKSLFQKYGSGRAVYLSEELKVFSEVGRHYEYLGALVKLEYIDFPLVFEVLAFPDDFLDESKDLIKKIEDEWDGPDHKNNEFWKNFKHLHKLYIQARKNNK